MSDYDESDVEDGSMLLAYPTGTPQHRVATVSMTSSNAARQLYPTGLSPSGSPNSMPRGNRQAVEVPPQPAAWDQMNVSPAKVRRETWSARHGPRVHARHFTVFIAT